MIQLNWTRNIVHSFARGFRIKFSENNDELMGINCMPNVMKSAELLFPSFRLTYGNVKLETGVNGYLSGMRVVTLKR